MNATNGVVGVGPWTLPEALAELVAAGDSDFVAGLIADFQTETAVRLERLRTAMANGDSARVRAEAHGIKGGARQMGGDHLAGLCQEIELDPAAPDLPERVDRLEVRFVALCREMDPETGAR